MDGFSNVQHDDTSHIIQKSLNLNPDLEFLRTENNPLLSHKKEMLKKNK